jgi:hypothetical protein
MNEGSSAEAEFREELWLRPSIMMLLFVGAAAVF